MSAPHPTERRMSGSGDQKAMLEELVTWLNRRFAREGVRFDVDTPLFEGGLIDSIRVLELIAWTERAIGREIADVQIRMDNFRTPARIVAVFAGGAALEALDAQR